MEFLNKIKESKVFSDEYFFEFARKLVAKGLIDNQKVKEKNILTGNPGIGTVDFIRQFHYSTSMDKYENIKKAVALFQLEIYKELVRKKYDVIFSEAILDGKDDSIMTTEEVEAYKEIKDTFKNFDLENPTPEQLKLFFTTGADIIYASLNKVKLMGTANNYLHIKAHESLGTAEKDRYVSLVRERYTAKKIREYLDQNKGERVGLVFGAAHNFGFDFMRDLPLEGFVIRQLGERKKEDRPVLNEISFPQMANLTDLLIRSKTILSPSLIKDILSSSLGLLRFKQERLRWQLREKKRSAREQVIVSKIVERAEKVQDLFKNF